MSGAFEVLYSFATNPGATITETAAATGQSLQIRGGGEGVTLEQQWAHNATGGLTRVRSVNMHDNTQGIRLRAPAAKPQLLLPQMTRVQLYETETIIVETTGGSSETDCVFNLIHYNNLPGQEANLKAWAEIQPRINTYMGVEMAAKTGAVGKWGAAVALNASMDLFKKPREYAIIGYQCSAEVGAVVLSGGGIGELRHGGPGLLEQDVTADWFVQLSEETGQPAIPVFNSQSVNQINVELGGGTAETESKITFICALLN